MARKENKVAKLRKDVDKLRKSYTGAMSSANQAVQGGFEKLVEHELTAIKTHYEAALKNLKQLRKGGDPKDLATAQLKLLQETIDRIMNNARESLSILDETRKQISADVRKELEATESKPAATRKTTTPRKTTAAAKKPATRKAPAKKTTARKPAARKPAAKKPAAKKTTASRSTSTAAGTAKKAPSTRKAPAKRRAPAKTTATRKTAATRKTSTATGSSGQS